MSLVTQTANLAEQLAHQRLTEDDEMADDTQARSDAYHEANDHVDTITPYEQIVNLDGTPAVSPQGSRFAPGHDILDSQGADARDAARRDEHKRKNVDADGSIIHAVGDAA
jgi:hypothetical protein